MKSKKYKDEQILEALRKCGEDRKQAAELLGMDLGNLYRRMKNIRQKTQEQLTYNQKESGDPDLEMTQSENSMSADAKIWAVNREGALASLIEMTGADMEVWEVKTWKAKVWNMGYKDKTTQRGDYRREDGKTVVDVTFQHSADKLNLYATSATFVKKTQTREQLQMAAIKEMEEEMKKLDPVRFVGIPKPPKDGYLFELQFPDLHMAKRAYGPEVIDHGDSLTTQAMVEDVMSQIMEDIKGLPISRFVSPVGNDLLHFATAAGTTVKGTHVDPDSRLKLMYKRAYKLERQILETLAEIAPVDVLAIEGNHDGILAWTLVHALHERYEETDRISVDIGERKRKYYMWNQVLLGFAHGDTEKNKKDLPQVMTDDLMRMRRGDWLAKAKLREWHLGHLHSEHCLPVGMTKVRTLPALSLADAWHDESMYRSPKETQCFLWGDDRLKQQFHYQPDASLYQYGFSD